MHVLLVFALTASIQQAESRQLRLHVAPNVQVSSARATAAHAEVVMAADPADANRLVACSMLVRENGTMTTAAYVSFDGAKSWSPAVLSDAPSANDPTCAYGPAGTLYFAHKARTPTPQSLWASDSDRLIIHRSRDGGRTWEPPIRGPQTTDRPWIAVDPRIAAPWGRLYVAYNGHVHATDPDRHETERYRNLVALRGSSDGGRTFDSYAFRALMDQSAAAGSNAAMSDAHVLSDGSIAVLYTQQQVGGRNAATAKLTELSASLHVLRSADGGESLEPATRVSVLKSGYNAPHTRGVPARMAVDPGSAAFRDRLYVTWADYSDGRGRIMVSHSADLGRTWSQPAVVNDDAAPGPDASHHFMPTVAVNREGTVGILWYDRREHPDNQGYYARFAASADGGVTWSPSVRVSSAPNGSGKPATNPARTPTSAAAANSFLLTGGDTAGLSASADGRFHALWVDNRTGIQQVWTAAITISR
jgi:hypothetical protein